MLTKVVSIVVLVTSCAVHAGEFAGSNQVDPPSVAHPTTNSSYSRGSIVSGPHSYNYSHSWNGPNCPSGQKPIVTSPSSGSGISSTSGTYLCIKT